MTSQHAPVMLGEVLSFVAHPGARVVVDATAGGGGHSEAILERVPGVELLVGIDRDEEAADRARARLARFGRRARVVKASFDRLGDVLDRLGMEKADAIVMDLGVSSYHLDEAERGFSFRLAGPLDMRMDRRRKLTAADIVNAADERELASIFRKYGEERKARRIAWAIARERRKAPIEDTLRLARIVEKAAGAPGGPRRIHPATRVFQALRMAVNDELGMLERGILEGVERLSPGGRIVVISFHSLEDRKVKQTFAGLTRRCVCPKELPKCVCGRPGKLRLLTKKPLRPGEKEVSENPRSRSAKLRAAERLAA
ncbi:MAG: 16S rRNA (cytosine(1402)-N(4))-methyltransferase RsmH [Candidatus Nitrospinota bacterium M3_3B_026]